MIENTKVGSGTRPTFNLIKKLSESINRAKNTEVVKDDDSSNNEIIKKSLFCKKLNVPTGYFTSLRSKKIRVSFYNF